MNRLLAALTWFFTPIEGRFNRVCSIAAGGMVLAVTAIVVGVELSR